MLPNNSVLVRFSRLAEGSTSRMDGFFIDFGCGGDESTQEGRCSRQPALLMTSNSMQSAACSEHIVAVLSRVIDAVLKARSEESGYGFLYRPREPMLKRERTQKSPSATSEVVWSSRVDDRYDVLVYRTEKPYEGALVIRDGGAEVARVAVTLSFNAKFGPDGGDVEQWHDQVTAMIDAAKPAEQLLQEALERCDHDRARRIAILTASQNGAAAFAQAMKIYGRRELAIDWLISPNGLFHGRAPVEVLDTSDATGRINRALENVRKTLYPLGDEGER